MELDRVAALVKRLSDATRAGKLNWKEESTSRFVVQVGKHVVSVGEYDDPSGDPFSDPDYVVAVRRPGSGVPGILSEEWIDSFTDEELKEVLPGSFRAMQALYRDARRNARGVEGVLDELLKDLE